jgi:small subunit ribosomal protein S17
VIADKSAKTIRVQCDFTVRVPKYGKYVRRSTVLHAHDENREAHEGDVVELAACRRLSKLKCWRLTRVLRKA